MKRAVFLIVVAVLSLSSMISAQSISCPLGRYIDPRDPHAIWSFGVVGNVLYGRIDQYLDGECVYQIKGTSGGAGGTVDFIATMAGGEGTCYKTVVFVGGVTFSCDSITGQYESYGEGQKGDSGPMTLIREEAKRKR